MVAFLIAVFGMSGATGAAVHENSTQTLSDAQGEIDTLDKRVLGDLRANATGFRGKVILSVAKPMIVLAEQTAGVGLSFGYAFPALGGLVANLAPLGMFGMVGLAIYEQFKIAREAMPE
jgi:hypothetical protein